MTLVSVLSTGLIVWLFSGGILHIFTNNNEVLDKCKRHINIYVIALVADLWQFAIQSFFNGLGL